MKKKIYRKAGAFLLLLAMVMLASLTALAADGSVWTAKAAGSYKNPSTGEIEDAGGAANEDLGQSMVSNVIDSQALVEENPSGGYEVSMRFHLMNSLSEIQLSTQKPGESDWKTVTYVQTGEGEDQADLRIPLETRDSMVRAACYVEAMGRNVIFYVTFTDFEEGNAGNFALMDSQESALTGVTGLTTGGSTGTEASKEAQTATEAQAAPSATLSAAGTAENTAAPQQLNLSAGVWWMLFAVVFCAHVLAGLVLMGIRMLLHKGGRKPDRDYEEDPVENQEFREFSEDDWKALSEEQDE